MEVMEKAEKKKLRRIASANEAIMLLKDTGTGSVALDFLKHQGPKDKHGRLTGRDFPAKTLVEALEERIEEQDKYAESGGDEGEWFGGIGFAGHPVGALPISRLTLDKLKKLVRTGSYTDPVKFEAKLPIEFASEEYDPDEDEEEAELPKSKKGRKKLAVA